MVAPVLYASQWFLTLFACPFPSHFSARIMDIIMFKVPQPPAPPAPRAWCMPQTIPLTMQRPRIPPLGVRNALAVVQAGSLCDARGSRRGVWGRCGGGRGAQGTSDILLQTALAVVAECEKQLLELQDFEDILTHLKVPPQPRSARSLDRACVCAWALGWPAVPRSCEFRRRAQCPSKSKQSLSSAIGHFVHAVLSSPS